MSLARRLLLAAAGGGAFTYTIEDDDVALGWFNVKTYGATGDGSTDDTSAINAAIAAWNAAGAGVLYVPAGTYRVTGALTTVTASGSIFGDGPGSWSAAGSLFGGSSIIECESATAVLFTLNGGTRVEGLSILNTAGSAASAGAAIHVVNGSVYRQRVMVEDCFFEGFYDTIDVQTNSTFYMSNVGIANGERYGVRIRNTLEVDAGGAVISGCAFVGEAQAGYAGIFIESSGGNKIIGTTVNNWGDYGILLVAAADSSILLIGQCSIENYQADAIQLDANGHAYSLVTITGCQFGQYGNGTGHAILTDEVDDISISGCVFRASTGTPTAVSLNNGTRGYVGPMVNNGFSTLVATSSFTSLDNDAAGA